MPEKNKLLLISFMIFFINFLAYGYSETAETCTDLGVTKCVDNVLYICEKDSSGEKIWVRKYECSETCMYNYCARRPPCENYGDVDGDGMVTKKDLIKAVSMFFSDESSSILDLNGNGRSVESEDVNILINYLNERISTFPVCPLPDLIVKDAWLDQDTEKLHYIISNIGNDNVRSYTYTRIYVNGRSIMAIQTPYIAAGSEWRMGVPINEQFTSGSEVRVCADGENVVKELNEENNCFTFVIEQTSSDTENEATTEFVNCREYGEDYKCAPYEEWENCEGERDIIELNNLCKDNDNREYMYCVKCVAPQISEGNEGDLIISDISFEPNPVIKGDRFTLKVSIQNTGTVAEGRGKSIRCSFGGGALGSTEIRLSNVYPERTSIIHRYYYSSNFPTGDVDICCSIEDKRPVCGTLQVTERESGTGEREQPQGEPEQPPFPEENKISIYLKKGWNMISIPGDIRKEIIDINEILDDCKLKSFNGKYVWEWDPRESRFKSYSDRIGIWKGHYLYSEENCKAVINVREEMIEVLRIYKGWNMVPGAGITLDDLLEFCDLRRYKGYYIWYWNPESEKWEHPEILEKGRAYWIYSEKACRIRLNEMSTQWVNIPVPSP